MGRIRPCWWCWRHTKVSLLEFPKLCLQIGKLLLKLCMLRLQISEKWPRLGASTLQNATHRRWCSELFKKPAQSRWKLPRWWQTRFRTYSPDVQDSKSVGLGTFQPLSGGLRAQNRKLANQRDRPKISEKRKYFETNLKN